MSKKLTRQRKWQIMHRVNGLCQFCSEPAIHAGKCVRHWFSNTVKRRDRYRDSIGSVGYICLTQMIQHDLTRKKWSKATRERIRAKFGKDVDIMQFLNHD